MPDDARTFVRDGHLRIYAAVVASDFWDGYNPSTFRPRNVLAKRVRQEVIVECEDRDVLLNPGDFLVTDDPPTHAWVMRDGEFQRLYERVP